MSIHTAESITSEQVRATLRQTIGKTTSANKGKSDVSILMMCCQECIIIIRIVIITRQMLQHRGGEPSTNYSEFEIHACLFFRNLSKVIKGLSGFSQWQKSSIGDISHIT